jgi:flagellum-specific ATP synthase
MSSLGLGQLKDRMRGATTVRQIGRVLQVVGTIIEAELPGVSVGAIADVGDTQVEVVGFRENRALLMPLGELEGISHGDGVRVRGGSLTIPVGKGLLGRVIDPLGNPLDGEPLRDCPGRRSLHSDPPQAMARTRITKPLARRAAGGNHGWLWSRKEHPPWHGGSKQSGRSQCRLLGG